MTIQAARKSTEVVTEIFRMRNETKTKKMEKINLNVCLKKTNKNLNIIEKANKTPLKKLHFRNFIFAVSSIKDEQRNFEN